MSLTGIQLIVGLANPGDEYTNTRHNAGAWFVEEIVRQANASLRLEKKFHGLHTTAKIDGHSCQLLIPTTFMNLSGRSVRACAGFSKIASESILIAHDDIDLPVGTIKLKFDGGDGGHNGLNDIIRNLNTRLFYRLRIGVGHPGNSKDVVDYVLKNPSKADRKLIDIALEDAQSALPLILNGEMSKAMQALHTKK